MHLLKAEVDLSTICQWLGHASPTTTNRYAAVDLDMKREALARAHPPDEPGAVANWRRDASILDWLATL